MATMQVQMVDVKAEPIATISSQVTKRSVEIEPESEVNTSSSGSDLFDVDSTSAKQGFDRFGSFESGTSTGITSLSSSTTRDDSINSQLKLTPSKKRMLNGAIKPKSPTTSTNISPSIQKSSKQHPLSHIADIYAESSKLGSRRKSQQDDTPRPRSSIPSSLTITTFANQCIEAAVSSRLDPYSLHEGEHDLLVSSITSAEVTIYLNIRNAILRLWLRNPLCSVTPEEAAGCAKESRHFGLASVAHQWLSRNGYINFGCVERPSYNSSTQQKSGAEQKTVVVIGAGVSGLTTARQLETLFADNAEHWHAQNQDPPRVIVLEGRRRIGGRIYSKPLRSQNTKQMPGEFRNTAEMGAMIVTGFDRGNPLDVVVRGQLGLHYHCLKDALTIYDCDGKPVNEQRDMLNTDLYTDISDRTGEFRAVQHSRQTLRGDEDLINRYRDPVSQHTNELQLEPLPDTFDPLKQRKPISKRGRRTNAPPGTEKLTGRSQVVEGEYAAVRAARAAQQMGWHVRDGVSKNHTVSLRQIAESCSHPSLGYLMDSAILQYQSMLHFKPVDMRLLNWHHANLEYANAAPVSWLSLSGHDQDNGNEFEGAHSEIVGGYTQLPRALLNLPTKLDVRFDHTVDSIHYNEHPDSSRKVTTKIVCTNGEVIEADEVVMTAPLGVLKSNMIDFDPSLPAWKRGAIDRMGFGLLNKVILVYDEPFWDESRDMFGLLNEAEEQGSLDPEHYEAKRGRFYLIWNASKISGRPMLIALMAGHAAYQAEVTNTPSLLDEVTERLRKVFPAPIPAPREVIVTRWKQDPYSRGTYSYVAPQTRPSDYNVMAQSVGNLHFGGEATCGTHPATVHGAFLSGLRVASDVVESMMGSIELPNPLVGQFNGVAERLMSRKKSSTTPAPLKRTPSGAKPTKTQTVAKPSIPAPRPATKPGIAWVAGPPAKSVCASDSSYWVTTSFDDSPAVQQAMISSVVFAKIGDRPIKPTRPGTNPFLLYTKAHWDKCKAEQSDATSAGRNAIRQILGQWWKDLTEDERQPYVEQSKAAQDIADAERKDWERRVKVWDQQAKQIKEEYLADKARQSAATGGAAASASEVVSSSGRKTNVSTR